MKPYETAQRAIDEQQSQLAEQVILYLQRYYRLNYHGIREYLKANGVDTDAWEELIATI